MPAALRPVVTGAHRLGRAQISAIATRVGSPLHSEPSHVVAAEATTCGRVAAMTHVDISLTWQRIEVWSYDAAATRPIRIDRFAELDDLSPAVYKLEFLDSSGALPEGPNTYVGETSGIRSRLETHRYVVESMVVRSGRRFSGICSPVGPYGSRSSRSTATSGSAGSDSKRRHGSCAGCSNRPRSLRPGRTVPFCSTSSNRSTRSARPVQFSLRRRRTRHRAA